MRSQVQMSCSAVKKQSRRSDATLSHWLAAPTLGPRVASTLNLREKFTEQAAHRTLTQHGVDNTEAAAAVAAQRALPARTSKPPIHPAMAVALALAAAASPVHHARPLRPLARRRRTPAARAREAQAPRQEHSRADKSPAQAVRGGFPPDGPQLLEGGAAQRPDGHPHLAQRRTPPR